MQACFISKSSTLVVHYKSNIMGALELLSNIDWMVDEVSHSGLTCQLTALRSVFRKLGVPLQFRASGARSVVPAVALSFPAAAFVILLVCTLQGGLPGRGRKRAGTGQCCRPCSYCRS